MAKRHMNRVGNLESMFVRLEELVLANSGADEFEEVFKLIIGKLFDELRYGGRRFRVYEEETETYRVVVDLLREAGNAWPGITDALTGPELTPTHLQVCVEALAEHRITESTYEVMDSFFEFIVSRTAKGAKGQYFTPRHVVEFCVRMLQPNRQETVLDPACGSGGFLVHTLNYVRQVENLTVNECGSYASEKLWGFDIDPRVVRVAKALMVVAGAGESNRNILRLNSLLKPAANAALFQDRNDSVVTIEDVCRSRFRRHKGFDVVLTNPPFAGEVREQQILGEYRMGQGRSRVERDILFLERCIDVLRPGGRMAVVLPHNKFAADAYTDMRRWLFSKAQVLAVVGLGRHTFLPHTHQKASVLFARKLEAGEDEATRGKIFFAVSERDGKNSKGELILKDGAMERRNIWECVDHDLAEVVDAFSEFCQAEGIRLGSV